MVRGKYDTKVGTRAKSYYKTNEKTNEKVVCNTRDSFLETTSRLCFKVTELEELSGPYTGEVRQG